MMIILFLVNHRMKIKDGEKIDKYLDLAREPKTFSDMMVTVIPIVVVALGTVTKNLEERPEELEMR